MHLETCLWILLLLDLQITMPAGTGGHWLPVFCSAHLFSAYNIRLTFPLALLRSSSTLFLTWCPGSRYRNGFNVPPALFRWNLDLPMNTPSHSSLVGEWHSASFLPVWLLLTPRPQCNSVPVQFCSAQSNDQIIESIPALRV